MGRGIGAPMRTAAPTTNPTGGNPNALTMAPMGSPQSTGLSSKGSIGGAGPNTPGLNLPMRSTPSLANDIPPFPSTAPTYPMQPGANDGMGGKGGAMPQMTAQNMPSAVPPPTTPGFNPADTFPSGKGGAMPIAGGNTNVQDTSPMQRLGGKGGVAPNPQFPRQLDPSPGFPGKGAPRDMGTGAPPFNPNNPRAVPQPGFPPRDMGTGAPPFNPNNPRAVPQPTRPGIGNTGGPKPAPIMGSLSNLFKGRR